MPPETHPPETHQPETQTCYFLTLPNELLLAISKLLPLNDIISLADTCSTCRSLVSDAQCKEACTRAGLNIPQDVGPRAMAKLLYRPRVGVSNWSKEGGVPKGTFSDSTNVDGQEIHIYPREENLDFSKIWPISSAVEEALCVDLHPSFTVSRHIFLSEEKSFEQVHLRIARKSHILLVNHRLYVYEYATSPPLDELRIMIKSDGSIAHNDVTFRVSCSDFNTKCSFQLQLFSFRCRYATAMG
jgi:F-box domain